MAHPRMFSPMTTGPDTLKISSSMLACHGESFAYENTLPNIFSFSASRIYTKESAGGHALRWVDASNLR